MTLRDLPRPEVARSGLLTTMMKIFSDLWSFPHLKLLLHLLHVLVVTGKYPATEQDQSHPAKYPLN